MTTKPAKHTVRRGKRKPKALVAKTTNAGTWYSAASEKIGIATKSRDQRKSH
jgi:hypothetical protein